MTNMDRPRNWNIRLSLSFAVNRIRSLVVVPVTEPGCGDSGLIFLCWNQHQRSSQITGSLLITCYQRYQQGHSNSKGRLKKKNQVLHTFLFLTFSSQKVWHVLRPHFSFTLIAFVALLACARCYPQEQTPKLSNKRRCWQPPPEQHACFLSVS